MNWGKIYGDLYDNEKIVEAGDAATGMWARGLSYAIRHETDGRVPKSLLKYFAGNNWGREVKTLVAQGLWVPTKDGSGWQFLNWDRWQKTHEQAINDRAGNAASQQRRRGRRAGRADGLQARDSWQDADDDRGT